MNKQIKVEFDASTWTSGPPSSITKLPKTWNFDLGLALAHLALRTRPPGIHGFDLSDTWAILRYGYAFIPGLDFRLRSEWIDTDPHQKTILSDDLGVGLTTYFLADKLNAIDFYDCRYFMKYFPGTLGVVGKGKKNGEFKTPDFIFTDGRGQLSMVECKGTQSSVYQLDQAMKRGLTQKNNVTSGARKLKHSLVMGVFLPQFNSKENSMLRIIDPSWDEFSNFLLNIETRDLRRGMAKYDLARDMSLLSLPVAARRFSSVTPVEDVEDSTRFSQEINRSLNTDDTIGRQLTLEIQGDEGLLRNISVKVRDGGGIRERLLSMRDSDIDEIVDFQINQRRNRSWKTEVQDGKSKLTSPTGLSVEVTFDE